MTIYETLLQMALQDGAERAVLIETEQVVVDDRVRLKCRVPICREYNHCLMCPPNTLAVSEFRGFLGQYNRALLVQVRAGGSSEDDVIQAELKVQNLITALEKKALMAGCYFAAGFGAAHCRLCPECVGVNSGERCRYPFQARPSMEGVGIDIYKTCENAGVPVNLLDPDALFFAGLLLLD